MNYLFVLVFDFFRSRWRNVEWQPSQNLLHVLTLSFSHHGRGFSASRTFWKEFLYYNSISFPEPQNLEKQENFWIFYGKGIRCEKKTKIPKWNLLVPLVSPKISGSKSHSFLYQKISINPHLWAWVFSSSSPHHQKIQNPGERTNSPGWRSSLEVHQQIGVPECRPSRLPTILCLWDEKMFF